MSVLASEDVLSFSQDGSLLACVDNTGHLRTFDAGTGRLAVHVPLDLKIRGEHATCACWAQPQAHGAHDSVVMVGTSVGHVHAVSSSSGEVHWLTEVAGQREVTGLASSSTGRKVASVGGDARLRLMDPGSGAELASADLGSDPPSCVAMSPGGERCLVAGHNVALWEAGHDGWTCVARFSGHKDPARAIAFAPQGAYAVSAGLGERSVAVWYTPASFKSAKKRRPPVALLSTAEPVLQLSTALLAPDQDEWLLLAVCEGGSAYVWECLPEPGNPKALTHHLRAHVTTPPAADGNPSTSGIVAAYLEAGGSALRVARGISAVPVLERVILPQSSAEATEITLPPLQGGMLLPHTPRRQPPPARKGPAGPGERKAKHIITVLGPGSVPEEGLNRYPKLQAKKRALEDSVPGPELELASSGEARGGTKELTLMEQLAELEVGKKAMVDGSKRVPTAGSITRVLTQALRSQDMAMLETCFTSGHAIIEATVRELASTDAGLLLTALVNRFQYRTGRCAMMVPWIRSVLMHHTAYLCSAPGARGALSGLYEAIEARLTTHDELASLRGRLTLLLALIPEKDATLPETMGPEVHYVEGDSEEESDEDAMLDGEDDDEDWDSDDDIMEPLEADEFDDVDESDDEDDIE